MTEEEQKAAVEKTQNSIDSLKEAIKAASTKEEFEVLQKDFTELAESLKDISKEEIDALVSEVAELKENIKKSDETKKSFAEEVKDRMSEIQEVVKGANKNGIVIKANVTRASITNNTQSMHLPDIGQLGVRERSLYNITPKFPVSMGNHRGVITYTDWDEASIVRAAQVVAEGGTFPESTAVFREYNIPLRKIGDTLPVSEEFGEDQQTAAAELDMFLRVNVATRIDDQIMGGSGTGENLLGLLNSIPTYTAPDESIQDANIYDLVKRMRTAITATRGSKYMPDFVVMNSNTMDRLGLEKDGENNYLFLDIQNIGPIMIVEDNYVPDNQLAVGDRRFMRIYEMDGVELTEGMTGNQFVQDLKTIKARKRILFLIREVDKTGFLLCNDITAALASLTA